ncbi:MAG: hypothetical protein WC655_19935 [Candidatus Hydrogenedentales bacterium]|jgi:hypothetical protein
MYRPPDTVLQVPKNVDPPNHSFVRAAAEIVGAPDMVPKDSALITSRVASITPLKFARSDASGSRYT